MEKTKIEQIKEACIAQYLEDEYYTDDDRSCYPLILEILTIVTGDEDTAYKLLR